ncbi:DUF302 domain-containing protein [Pelagibius sp. 7325]|uniref:DUF302 domain-containing protein n=1 Tax=Pelagibius sp. 7325 TaxID=3131994 RepID=UPI0030EBA2CF
MTSRAGLAGGAVIRRHALAGLIAVAGATTISQALAKSLSKEDSVKLKSAYPYAETLERLRAALKDAGFTIFAEIDHSAAAHSVGLEMPPTVVVIYGNPRGGTPLMLAAPDFALELPLRVLVREAGAGACYVTFNRSEGLEEKHGLPAGMTARLAPAEAILMQLGAVPVVQE